MKRNKGFTLIELLVIVAIIGILSSVVLISLTSSRRRAQSVAFKKEVVSYQSRAQLDCTGFNGIVTGPVDTKNTDWPNTLTCLNGVFSITATSLMIDTCTAIVTESAVTYSAECK